MREIVVVTLIFSIPVLAVIGGIVHGIVKTVGRQRLEELARRERIAALERGIDLKDLPAFPSQLGNLEDPRYALERIRTGPAKWLKIAGVFCILIGAALGIHLVVLGIPAAWTGGLILPLIGVALLISARIVRSNGSPPATTPPSMPPS